MKKHRNRFGGKRLGALWSRKRKAALSPDQWRYQFEPLEHRVLLASDMLAAANLSGIRSLLASCSSAAQPAVTVSSQTQQSTASVSDESSANGLAATPQVQSLAITPLDSTPTFHANVRMNITDLNGTPITSIPVGSDFLVAAMVEDKSTLPAQNDINQTFGVFSAYTDVTYNSTLVSIPSGTTFTYGTEYTSQKRGTFGTAGLISDAGALTKDVLEPLGTGPGEFLLWSLKVHAAATGTATFTPGPAANGDGINVFRNDVDLTSDQLTFTSDSVTIQQLPVLSIANASVAEGNSGNTDLVFNVTLSSVAGTTFPVTVQFTTADGTATLADNDYVATSGTLTFAEAGTQTITVHVVGDTNEENDETFALNLSSPENATLQNTTGTGTIKNDDTTVSIADVSHAEGNSGMTNFTFTVSLSKPSVNDVTVEYETSDGTATTADDYIGQTSTLTIAAGTISQTITIQVKGDTKFEQDETFSVTLSNQTNATLGASVATGTITNDDGLLSVQNVQVTEGNSLTTNMVFTVTLSSIDDEPITVEYNTADGTAMTSDSDYVPTSGTLTFLPGEGLTQQVTVAVNGDTKVEGDETFKLELSNNSSNSAITTPFATGTIVSDDLPTLSISDISANEGDTGQKDFVFTVTLSQPFGQAVTVHYFTTNDTATTADNDYVGTSGDLTFAVDGPTSQTVTVKVVGDMKSEANETFNVVLQSPNHATLATHATGIGTIEDDDPLPNVSINSHSAVEGNSSTTTFVFNVTLSVASGQPVTVQFATQDGSNATATLNATAADNDYTPTSGTLTFAPGELSKSITVNVIGDTKVENDESFQVVLSNGNGKANLVPLTNADGLGTIQNDDTATVTITDVTLTEGNTGQKDFVFNVTLSSVVTTQPVTVTYHTVDGTATVLDGDYIGQTSTVTFDPGVTLQHITIPVKGDTKDEANETFQVQLDEVSGPAGVTLSTTKSAGIGTITNDDTPPTLSIDNFTHAEGDTGTTPFVFTVTLSGASGQQVTVQYATANGNNADATTNATTANNDYQATSGTLTFAPGALTAQLTVQVVGDLFKENDETFLVNLSTPVNATIATAQGKGVIQNETTDTVVVQPSTISGFVFVDTNGDSIKQTAEAGLAGKTLTLTGTPTQGGSVSLTTTTLADGSYSFTGILPGQYTISETQPDPFPQGHDIPGSLGGTNPSTNQLTVTIPAAGGATATNYNFAEGTLPLSMVSLRLMMASTPSPSDLTHEFVTTGHVTTQTASLSSLLASASPFSGLAALLSSNPSQLTDLVMSQQHDWLSAA